MPSRTSSEVSFWLRVGLLVLPLLMGVALVGGALSSRQRIHEASRQLIRAQVDGFARSLASTLRGHDGPPDSELLADALAELEADGLRYIAVLDRRGRPTLQAGEPSGGSGQVQTEGRVQIEPLKGRVRATLEPPARAWRRFHSRRSRARIRPGSGPPILRMEFEPLLAERLRKDADRAFGLSALTAVFLMLTAGGLWWQLRRQELLAASAERERRLAQLGEMSAVLAHEMRNPLASLKGHAQLLQEQLPGDSREARKAERIVGEAERLEALSRTLLDFVRSGNVERQAIDVVSLVREVIEEAAPERVQLVTEGDLARPAELDPLRMRQVLLNLLDNALEVTPSDCLVQVRVERKPRRLVIQVHDRGPGLPAGEEQKIFEAFHTKKTHGTGLGLAIARRIVELHDGTLKARNAATGGAVFDVEIPA